MIGIVEDKVIKNNYAAEHIYNAYRDTKTCGIIAEDEAYGVQTIVEPIGIVAAVIPTTNPSCCFQTTSATSSLDRPPKTSTPQPLTQL